MPRWATAEAAAHLAQPPERLAGPVGVLHRRVKRYPLVGQERRVRREDAVLRAQADQLVDQLLVLAAQVDLVDQVADAPRGPDPLDELVACCPGRCRRARPGIRTTCGSPAILPEIRSVVRPDWR